jgi:hypothetical protein
MERRRTHPSPRRTAGPRSACPARGTLAAGLLAAWSLAAAASPPPVGTLDCRNVTADQVATVLTAAPAPRILALQGSVPIVTMAPFADFLAAMGYPQERLTHPTSGARSLASFVDARRLAGEIAWHYERDGVMPMLIGHSQGGMAIIKTLHELARPSAPIPVWNPGTATAESRTWIVEPRTGVRRPVHELRVPFAAALATGSLPRLLLGQWDVLPILKDVPDSVAHFTGFAIPWDPIAGTGPDPEPFRATGTAIVRNVVLPASYSHVGLPNVDHLAQRATTRAWIDAWRPDAPAEPLPDGDVTNLVHAAELWYSVKLHWCEAAQTAAAGDPAP